MDPSSQLLILKWSSWIYIVYSKYMSACQLHASPRSTMYSTHSIHSRTISGLSIRISSRPRACAPRDALGPRSPPACAAWKARQSGSSGGCETVRSTFIWGWFLSVRSIAQVFAILYLYFVLLCFFFRCCSMSLFLSLNQYWLVLYMLTPGLSPVSF